LNNATQEMMRVYHDQIAQQCWQAIALTLQPVELDLHVLAFDVASFVEAFAKRGHIARVGLGRPVSDKPNHRHRRLLRARRERPRRRIGFPPTSGKR
jgi:hypothetical protein